MSDQECRNDCTRPLRFPRRPGTELPTQLSQHCACGCASPAVGISQDNRPSLPHVNYRIGIYASIREFLFRQIDETPVLQPWTHRSPDDPAVALFEAPRFSVTF